MSTGRPAASSRLVAGNELTSEKQLERNKVTGLSGVLRPKMRIVGTAVEFGRL